MKKNTNYAHLFVDDKQKTAIIKEIVSVDIAVSTLPKKVPLMYAAYCDLY